MDSVKKIRLIIAVILGGIAIFNLVNSYDSDSTETSSDRASGTKSYNSTHIKDVEITSEGLSLDGRVYDLTQDLFTVYEELDSTGVDVLVYPGDENILVSTGKVDHLVLLRSNEESEITVYGMDFTDVSLLSEQIVTVYGYEFSNKWEYTDISAFLDEQGIKHTLIKGETADEFEVATNDPRFSSFYLNDGKLETIVGFVTANYTDEELELAVLILEAQMEE